MGTAEAPPNTPRGASQPSSHLEQYCPSQYSRVRSLFLCWCCSCCFPADHSSSSAENWGMHGATKQSRSTSFLQGHCPSWKSTGVAHAGAVSFDWPAGQGGSQPAKCFLSLELGATWLYGLRSVRAWRSHRPFASWACCTYQHGRPVVVYCSARDPAGLWGPRSKALRRTLRSYPYQKIDPRHARFPRACHCKPLCSNWRHPDMGAACTSWPSILRTAMRASSSSIPFTNANANANDPSLWQVSAAGEAPDDDSDD